MAWWPAKNGRPVRRAAHLNFLGILQILSSLKKSRWGMSTMTELCRGAGLQVSRLVAGCYIAYYRSPDEKSDQSNTPANRCSISAALHTMATRWTKYECPDTVRGKAILITGEKLLVMAKAKPAFCSWWSRAQGLLLQGARQALASMLPGSM